MLYILSFRFGDLTDEVSVTDSIQTVRRSPVKMEFWKKNSRAYTTQFISRVNYGVIEGLHNPWVSLVGTQSLSASLKIIQAFEIRVRLEINPINSNKSRDANIQNSLVFYPENQTLRNGNFIIQVQATLISSNIINKC